MRTPAEIFDWACRHKWKDKDGRSYGNRYNPKSPHEIAIFDFVIHRAEEILCGAKELFPNLPPVHVGFIDNGTSNALADMIERDGTGDLPGKLPCIGIFRGTVLLLHDWFYRLLSHPRMFVLLGNNWDEIEHVQHLDGIFSDIDELREARAMNNEPLETFSPIDPTRRWMAMLCFNLALDFMLGHELAHLGKGHVNYLHIERGLPFVLEANAKPFLSNEEAALEFQTLEFDADGMAGTSFGLHLVLKSAFPEPLSTPESKLFLWAFSVASVFHVWGLSLELDRLESSCHPPTIARLCSMYYYADLVVKAQVPSLLPQTHSTLAKAFDALASGRFFLGLKSNEFVATLDDEHAEARYQKRIKSVIGNGNSLMAKVSHYGYLSKVV